MTQEELSSFGNTFLGSEDEERMSLSNMRWTHSLLTLLPRSLLILNL